MKSNYTIFVILVVNQLAAVKVSYKCRGTAGINTWADFL